MTNNHHNPDHLLSVQDVYNVISEHLTALDELWPDGDCGSAPRKVHLVELIDGIKLKLSAVAEKNLTRYESAFEAAARRVTGTPRIQERPKTDKPGPDIPLQKTSMQLAHEAAQARIRK